MPRYKNCSGSTYKFYGVVFNPMDVHEVPSSISHPKFIITNEPETESTHEKTTEIADVSSESKQDDAKTTAIQQLLSGDVDNANNEGTKRGKRIPKGE